MSKAGLAKTGSAPLHPQTRTGQGVGSAVGQETERGSKYSFPRKDCHRRKRARCRHIFQGNLETDRFILNTSIFKMLATTRIFLKHCTDQTKYMCSWIGLGSLVYTVFCHLPSRYHKDLSFCYILVKFARKKNKNISLQKLNQLYFDLI